MFPPSPINRDAAAVHSRRGHHVPAEDEAAGAVYHDHGVKRDFFQMTA
jgi:hypothetical protein